MTDLLSVEEANGAESLLQELMFRSVPVYCVFNLCFGYLRFFILLVTIEALYRKNRRALIRGGVA
jgi:hypothetical protein